MTTTFRPSTQKLADWILAAKREPSALSSIKYHLVGRVALVGASLLSLAEAVCRIVAAGLAHMGHWMTLGYWQQAKVFGAKQLNRATEAGSISFRCFQSLLSPRTAAGRLHEREPLPTISQSPTPDEMRSRRVRHGAELIANKLRKQFERAQYQAAQEPDKAFEYLSAPAHFEGHTHIEKNSGYEVGVCHFIGRRPTMEDQHLTTSFQLRIKDKIYPIQLFGVFDGHGGGKASIYVRENLERILQETLSEFCADGLTDEAIWNALKITFVKLKTSFREPRSGTTATVAMILDGKLWTANVGDSRIILDNGVQLTEDAKPTDPYYKKGIENRGGQVFWGRVNGNLAVARAVGDHNVGAVSARPKIIAYPVSNIPKGSHLILACDGIYDVSSTRQVAAGVQAHKNSSVAELATNIVYSADAAHSTDNLSAMVVKL